MLRLDQAMQLLRQAGHALPDGVAGSGPWLQALIDGLVELSSRDPLTGLANRRSFDLALARELDRVARSGEQALLLAVDIDHFKRVNDTHGHGMGDEVIRMVSRAVCDSVRPMDMVARLGGEEFAVILPNCGTDDGIHVAERIRRRVAAYGVPLADGGQLHVTVSVGGAQAPQWVRSSALLWSERADTQLYRAKSSGRNLVCMEPVVSGRVSADEKEMLFALSSQQDFR
jgi:diguanylate cyclase (GGDEF)-like protein